MAIGTYNPTLEHRFNINVIYDLVDKEERNNNTKVIWNFKTQKESFVNSSRK